MQFLSPSCIIRNFKNFQWCWWNLNPWYYNSVCLPRDTDFYNINYRCCLNDVMDFHNSGKWRQDYGNCLKGQRSHLLRLLGLLQGLIHALTGSCVVAEEFLHIAKTCYILRYRLNVIISDKRKWRFDDSMTKCKYARFDLRTKTLRSSNDGTAWSKLMHNFSVVISVIINSD